MGRCEKSCDELQLEAPVGALCVFLVFLISYVPKFLKVVFLGVWSHKWVLKMVFYMFFLGYGPMNGMSFI